MNRPGLVFAACILAVAAAALAVRLPRLALRPMHCDEANQAVKAGLLLETGQYRYDPREHHGPSLYWLTLPSLRLSGARDLSQATETALRIVPVVFGAGAVLLLLLVADGLGRGAAAVAALLMALSPALVFYSRYYIQETLLVFFTLAAIGCGWRYVRSGGLGWAIAGGVSLGLMYATKETWILAAAAMAAGLVLAVAWTRWLDGTAAPLGTRLRLAPLLAAAAAACVVAVALYSSFGTHWRGPIDSVLSYEAYWRRGMGADHAHPWDYYFRLFTVWRPARGFFWPDGLIAGLALVGLVASLGGRKRNASGGPLSVWERVASGGPLSLWERVRVRAAQPAGPRGGRPHPGPLPEGEGEVPSDAQRAFARFLAFYTLLLLGLYAAIPYKTPWCMLGFLQGMILLAGVGAWAVVRRLPGWPLRALACLLLAAGVVHLGRQCYAVNFRFCTDPDNPYVYAHTTTDTVRLAEQIERLSGVAAEGHEMVIHVVTPDNYWPLPWYLRRFRRVGYWEDVQAWWRDTQGRPQAAVLILTPDIPEALHEQLLAAYQPQGIRGLRPEVFLMVYVRKDLGKALSANVRNEAASELVGWDEVPPIGSLSVVTSGGTSSHPTSWVSRTAKQLGLGSTLRSRGRPKREG